MNYTSRVFSVSVEFASPERLPPAILNRGGTLASLPLALLIISPLVGREREEGARCTRCRIRLALRTTDADLAERGN